MYPLSTMGLVRLGVKEFAAEKGWTLKEVSDRSGVGEGVCELRIDYGSGYRIYFGQIGTTIVLLLCGGDKSTQNRDILKVIEY